MDFRDWITQEINKRGWSMREASIKAGLSDSMVGKVISESIKPGLEFYRGISKAFGISLVEVLIKAGEVDPRDLSDEGLNESFARLAPWQQRMVLKFIDSISQEEESEQNPPIFTQTPRPKPKPSA
jgi:lambda repressor-like predicted transcriptional regulator